MNYELPPPLQDLRSELRRRIATAFPDGFPSIFVDDPAVLDASIQFCRRLGEDGLLTMAWPPEYGGAEASLWAQAVVAEEMWAHGEPRGAQYYGVNWIGPAIMRFGTPAQRALHLPMIARGEALWAQGYSEPDAGSDLASLRLRARRVAGGWELSGQKIWTSYASFARWCFLAARTDDSGSKHHGITVFLVPMDREGIEVRPIASVNSPHDLNEVFFDQAFASDDEVLGNVDDGWHVITASLTFERVGTARYARSDRLLSEARTAMLEGGKRTQPAAYGELGRRGDQHARGPTPYLPGSCGARARGGWVAIATRQLGLPDRQHRQRPSHDLRGPRDVRFVFAAGAWSAAGPPRWRGRARMAACLVRHRRSWNA